MRHVIPDLELAQIPELIDLKVKPCKTIMDEKVGFRRKRVNQLRLSGYTNQQIADKIGCDLSTVEKDLHAIRENARQWFECDAITEYCMSLYDGIILCDNITEELQILCSDESQVRKKLEILSLISTYQTRKTELFEKTQAVQAYRRSR